MATLYCYNEECCHNEDGRCTKHFVWISENGECEDKSDEE